jgi:hypothetical protein
MPTRRDVMGTALVASLVGGIVRPSAAAPGVITRGGLALDGYDSVAYWTAQKALKGQPSVTTQWNGATWVFVSQENRAAFVASPERYAPAFNGYCTY